jgi:hypothetical protein
MPRGLILAALAIAVTCASARAQSVTVPQTYPIPMPPMSQPNIEVGLRYWQSEGKTRFSINSSGIDPELGNPTSILTYDGMDGFSGEFFWYARNETDTFAKGFIGGGGLDGGSLDDEDYFAGQIKFLDTFSKLKGSDMVYGTIDIGQRFTLADGATRVTIGPFAGFNYWQETAEGFGARCNPDDVGGFFCGPAGSFAVPFSTQVITNEANWASLRLGAELKVRLWDRLTLVGDAAVLPVAYVWNDDSHLLRADLGPVPNIQDRGTGWGYQLEGAIQLDLTPCWAIGAGVRYWYAEVDGKSEFVNFDVKVPLEDFTSERLGVFGEVSYRFATF